MTTAALDRRLKLRRWLGYAGVLPFAVGLAILLFADDRRLQTWSAVELVHYAALITSFLGAVHWGAAIHAKTDPQAARLLWGVIPALVAWSLLSLPADIALAGFAALVAVILIVDLYLLPVLDDDYRRLRLRLSTAVIGCLLGSALIAPGAA